jgi:hypothetical protein
LTSLFCFTSSAIVSSYEAGKGVLGLADTSTGTEEGAFFP